MVNDPEPFPYIAPLAADWSFIDFQDLSLKRDPLGGSEEPETVVIYITGSATGDRSGNGRTIEPQHGSPKLTTDSEVQVRIQRRSRQSRHTNSHPHTNTHTTRDGPHDSSSPVSSIA